mmetsp:Transcript_31079/g.72675  ORF Transcript_31079/g.72675 Transcript_31079/m.72675 type:complete len:272 (+) Transcript_31079:254-1069(+)
MIRSASHASAPARTGVTPSPPAARALQSAGAAGPDATMVYPGSPPRCASPPPWMTVTSVTVPAVTVPSVTVTVGPPPKENVAHFPMGGRPGDGMERVEARSAPARGPTRRKCAAGASRRETSSDGKISASRLWKSTPALLGEQRTSTVVPSTATVARSIVRPTLLQKHAGRASPGTAPTNLLVHCPLMNRAASPPERSSAPECDTSASTAPSAAAATTCARVTSPNRAASVTWRSSICGMNFMSGAGAAYVSSRNTARCSARRRTPRRRRS